MLVQIIKNYSDDYSKYSPNQSMEWEDVHFSEKQEKEADFVVVLNTPKKNQTVRCNKNNIIAIMQEPYHEGDTDWMNDQLDKYTYVFTNHTPNPLPKNTQIIYSHGALHWYVNKTYDELKAMETPPEKTNTISCIASSLMRWPGHRVRVSFIEYAKQNNSLNIDFFGKGTKFLEDKWDGMSSYKYNIVIENESKKDYWTEKITDAYLSFSLPFYFGCSNIDDYFPKDSYIWIDITNPQKAMETMKEAIQTNEWEKRLEAIQEARTLVLDKYNLFPFVANFIKTLPIQTTKEKVILKKYQYPLKEIIRRKIERKKQQIKKLFL